MAQETQFETMDCTLCELLAMDAVDGTLSAGERAAFDRHVAGCVDCAATLAGIERGAAWMEMLKVQQPVPPADLLARILAETSGAASQASLQRASQNAVASQNVVASRSAAALAFSAAVAASPQAVLPAAAWTAVPAALPKPAKAGWLAGLRARFSMGGEGFAGMHPRFAMTTAMAFFSIALTLNMAGIRLVDLRPGTLQRTASDVRANLTRSLANMRVVRQMESRVDDLRGDSFGRNDNFRQNDVRDPAGPFGDGPAGAKPDGGKSDGGTSAPQRAPAPEPGSKTGGDRGRDRSTPQGTSQLQTLPGEAAPYFSPALSPRSNDASRAAASVRPEASAHQEGL